MGLREIRDPVHGFVSLDTTACELLDSQPMQRLRRIHQLAMASALYPGATHTRFEHSLGVYHIASAICERLKIGGDERRLIQHAALLHDVGHGPFSHVSEIPLARYSDREVLSRTGLGPEEVHEAITADIIERHPQLQHALSAADRECIAGLIRGTYPDPVAKAIISGPLDADKQDYLLRDSQMCGVQYGVFDLDRLIQSLTVVKDIAGETALAIESDSVHVVEQFLMAKYHITQQVYAHRVRLITDQMLVRAVILGVEQDGIDELHKLYAYDGSDAFIASYTDWDDYCFLTRFGDESIHPGYCAKLLNALQCRRLHKQMFEENLLGYGDQARVLFEPRDSLRARIEQEAAEAISSATGQEIDAHEVICYIYRQKSVRPGSGGEMSGMLVLADGLPQPFEQRSPFYQSIEGMRSDALIMLFAPVEYANDVERDRWKRELKEPLHVAIAAAAANSSDEGCSE